MSDMNHPDENPPPYELFPPSQPYAHYTAEVPSRAVSEDLPVNPILPMNSVDFHRDASDDLYGPAWALLGGDRTIIKGMSGTKAPVPHEMSDPYPNMQVLPQFYTVTQGLQVGITRWW